MNALVVEPDSFEPAVSYYDKVLNASLHPLVSSFFHMGARRIALRYSHLNPQVNSEFLLRLLTTRPKIFHWGGADLFKVSNHTGHQKMIVIETNSCPSGQKSTPAHSEEYMMDGYHQLMKKCFKTLVDSKTEEGVLPEGGLAVVYDKNSMENGAYAAAMSTVFEEKVFAVELHHDDPNPPVKFVDSVMQVRHEEKWHPIRAAFRYVTQKPWSVIPLNSRTLLLNPPVACLAGGRNKMAADQAYELLNNEIKGFGLKINVPNTIRDVQKKAVPLWVASMGGHAVVKNPYSNAGQGVWTITSPAELKAFMDLEDDYDKYIVQSLVGGANWSSTSQQGRYFHTGLIPNRRGQTFCADLRMMVVSTPEGWMPIASYSRRALKPLAHTITDTDDSWSMLGTNLSLKKSDGGWGSDTSRLLLMDMKDFNRLGLGIDDLIEAYVQTVLAMTAIDRMCLRLVDPSNNTFNFNLFAQLNNDPALFEEIRRANPDFVPDGQSAE